MGLLSLFKNINLGFGMTHIPTNTSAGTMEAKAFKEVKQDTKVQLGEDLHEATGVDKDTIIRNNETRSCEFGMDWQFNHPLREEEKVAGKLEEAVARQRRLAKVEGAQGLGIVVSSENVGQMECKLNFLGLPIRPGEKKCSFYMRTGGCKFASRCRFHHPDPTAVVGGSFQDRKNGVPSQHHGPVEQLCETPRPSENTSNELTDLLDSFTPNLKLQQTVHRNENQTVSNLLHPPEIKIIGQQKEVANKDAAYEFSGVEPQRYDEYPQKPSEPDCQYFMKTGYCKFKSACRYHHPKSNLSFLGLPLRSASEIYEQDDPVEQSSEMPLPSAKSPSNDHRAFLYSSSFNVPGLLTPNQGLQPISWNGDQTVTCQLHPPEIKINEKQQELANGDAAYEFSGVKPLQYDEYPQRPSEPECQYFMKTGYCKFKSTCRYHHPKSNLSFLGLPLRPACNSHEQDSTLKQMCEIPLPSENILNAPKEFLCSSPSNVPGVSTPNQGLVTPNQGLQSNAQWNGDQMATSPLHLPEIKIDEKGQKLADKDTSYEFNGGVKSQQPDEYPQRPDEPECKYFMKTGYCKFKSACRCHHPKPNPSFPAPSLKPDKPICTRYNRRGICKFGSACRYSHHMEHT